MQGQGIAIKVHKAKRFKSSFKAYYDHETSKEKVDLYILFAFSEMDALCFTDISSFPQPFVEGILFVLDHIAEQTHSESLTLSGENFLYDKGFIKNGDLPIFTEWANTFRDCISSPDIPIRVYGEHPLEQRVRIWNKIVNRLDSINGKPRYSIQHSLGSITISWTSELDKHLFIYPGVDGFKVAYRSDFRRGMPRLVDISSEDALLNFVSSCAEEKTPIQRNS